ncbi:MAG: aldose epimerase family protein [Bacteroidales bacterium]
MKKNIIIYTIAVALLTIIGCGQKSQKSKEQESMKKEQNIKAFTLTNENECEVKITNFGGKVMSLKVPDKDGNIGDVVLGYEHAEEYVEGNPFFGALVGRYGNRIGNAEFTLDGQTYELPKNDDSNHLHGGPEGFHNVIWNAEKTTRNGNEALNLTYVSEDGEMGFPGKLDVTVIYTLTADNELKIEYEATSNRKTVLNLTHHSFFNLKDAGKSKILEHELTINGDHFTPVSEELIPSGEIRPVENTPMDFRETKNMGDGINSDYQQIQYGNGFDHNWVLNKTERGELNLAASVYEPTTGRKMEVYTTEPGMQFYAGNFLDGSDVGKNDIAYEQRSGFCLETQHFPDSPNQTHFPSPVLKPGETYTQTTIYKFSTGK